MTDPGQLRNTLLELEVQSGGIGLLLRPDAPPYTDSQLEEWMKELTARYERVQAAYDAYLGIDTPETGPLPPMLRRIK